MSEIKVDALSTVSGSGNITASNTIAGTSATLSGTLAVTGDATFDTSTLKVDASNNRVGIGTASPGRKLELNNGGTGAFVTFTDGVATNFTFKTDGSNVGTFGTEAGSTHLGLMASGTERARIHSGGIMSVSNGIELGSGLDATAANVLDDYEEGQWTPDVRNNTSTSNWSTKKGDYVKIGRVVYCWFVVDHGNSNSGSGTAQLELSGLPFAVQLEANSGSTFAHNSTQSFGMWSSNPSNQVGNLMTAGSNTANLYKGGGGTASQLTFVSGSFCYIATT